MVMTSPGVTADTGGHLTLNISNPTHKRTNRVRRSVNRASSFFFVTDEVKVNADHESLAQDERVAAGWMQKLTKKANKASKSEGFHSFTVMAVFAHLFMSLTEVLLLLLVPHNKRTPEYYLILYIVVACSFFLMTLFCYGMLRASVCKVGFRGYFASLWNLSDLIFIIMSATVEIIAIFLSRHLFPIVISILLLKLYSSFRIARILNRNMIYREIQIIEDMREEIQELEQKHYDIKNNGELIRIQLKQYTDQIKQSQDDLSGITDKLLEAKKTSWSSMVPLIAATSISFPRRQSNTSRRSINSYETRISPPPLLVRYFPKRFPTKF